MSAARGGASAATDPAATDPAATDPAATDSAAHLAGLAAGLLAEYRHERLPAPPGLAALAAGGAPFGDALDGYRAARDRLAAHLDASFEPAAAYHSMREFWDDAAAQEEGRSDRSYWDSYENGRRRRAERVAAEAFGSEQAVLVNAGMSALDVAVRASGLRPGDRMLVHDRMYFESRDLLDGLYAPWGVRIVAADLRDPKAVADAVGEHRPALALAELALNGPRCDVPVLEPLRDAGVRTVLDCSALGHGVRPSALLTGPHVLYVESGMKYLTRQAGAGVVYGWDEWAAQARLCARRTGQQLQGRALHRLRPAEVAACRRRLAIHAARRERFAGTLSRLAPDLLVTDATSGAAGRDDLTARAVLAGASGCMVFVRLPEGRGGDHEEAHRAIVADWARRTGAPGVRAGFGWTRTTCRAYGRDTLNTGLGECFTRVSVGIEPPEDVERAAGHLAEAAREVIG
ncbi:hypothetical protein RVR_488 [Actinacidiphila reveromycinica]|uniref:Aminotransferase n=1 Tax=Actinacidiphila reveromycinica TaxID=659352 RepID=A0A7U3UN32_9ACTN|nr:PLP-dependent transferase [Streptomyces sp. SN-593]BBA95576.1 hypothetical protein RVR_488 [Streptomyces sp. SN-593]